MEYVLAQTAVVWLATIHKEIRRAESDCKLTISHWKLFLFVVLKATTFAVCSGGFSGHVMNPVHVLYRGIIEVTDGGMRPIAFYVLYRGKRPTWMAADRKRRSPYSRSGSHVLCVLCPFGQDPSSNDQYSIRRFVVLYSTLESTLFVSPLRSNPKSIL